MEYPEEFKEKVLSLTNNNEDIKRLLDLGNYNIGGMLFESCSERIDPEEIIKAYETNNFEEIYQKSKRTLAITKLYDEWLEIVNQAKTK